MEAIRQVILVAVSPDCSDNVALEHQMSSIPRILITRRLPAGVEETIRSRFEVIQRDDDRQLTRDELQQALTEADGILCTVGDRFTAEVFAGYPIRTRIIANFGVGVDHIDLTAAAAHDIVVTNTPDVLTDETADLAITLILMAMRRAGEAEREVRAGKWTGWRPTHMLGAKVSGKTLGVIGLGRIGRATARRAHFGFGMRVLGWSRTLPPMQVAVEHGIEPMGSLETLLRQSDVISLHVPSTPATRNLIDAARIALLPDGATLINTARGDVVDNEAMIAALASGKLRFAGLDVYPGEPRIDPRLFEMENVVLLPHIGSATVETRTAIGMRALENLEAFFAGGVVRDRVG